MPRFPLEQPSRLLPEVIKHFGVVEVAGVLEMPSGTTLWEVPSHGLFRHDPVRGMTYLRLGKLVVEDSAAWEQDFWDDDVPASFLALTPRGVWFAIGMMQVKCHGPKDQSFTARRITFTEGRTMLASLEVPWGAEPTQAELLAAGVIHASHEARVVAVGAGASDLKRKQWEDAAIWLAACFNMDDVDMEHRCFELDAKRDDLKARGYTHAHCGYVIKVLAGILGQDVTDLLAA